MLAECYALGMGREKTYRLIYSESRARAGRSAWVITIPAALSPTGKRGQKVYATEKAAKAELRALRDAQQRLGNAVRDIATDFEEQVLQKRAAAMAEKAGLRLHAAVHFAVECVEAFESLDEARRLLRWAKQHALQAWPNVTLLEAIEEHSKETLNLSLVTRRQRLYLKNRLVREAFYFTANTYLHELNTANVEKLLQDLAWTDQSANVLIRYLKLLCSWAQRKNYIDPHAHPLKHLALRRVKESEIVALQPAQMASLLLTACTDAHFINHGIAAALGAFAGIRPTECRRLRWEDVNEEEGVISVRGRASKTGGTRHVVLRPVLRAWLAYFAPPKGRKPDALVCPKYSLKNQTLYHAKAGLKKWPEDCLRHSFASYSIKSGTPLHDVQLDMGHVGLQLLRSRYLNMRGLTAAGAAEWWDLTPERVIEFHGNPTLP